MDSFQKPMSRGEVSENLAILSAAKKWTLVAQNQSMFVGNPLLFDSYVSDNKILAVVPSIPIKGHPDVISALTDRTTAMLKGECPRCHAVVGGKTEGASMEHEDWCRVRDEKLNPLLKRCVDGLEYGPEWRAPKPSA